MSLSEGFTVAIICPVAMTHRPCLQPGPFPAAPTHVFNCPLGLAHGCLIGHLALTLSYWTLSSTHLIRLTSSTACSSLSLGILPLDSSPFASVTKSFKTYLEYAHFSSPVLPNWSYLYLYLYCYNNLLIVLPSTPVLPRIHSSHSRSIF